MAERNFWRALRVPGDKVTAFMEYILTTYVERNSNFPPTMWAGLEGNATNNGPESFHRVFGDLFGYLKCKPGIWHFLRNMNRFNIIKNIKMISKKQLKSNTNEAEKIILKFMQKKFNVTKMMQQLSALNQPKCRLRRTRKI